MGGGGRHTRMCGCVSNFEKWDAHQTWMSRDMTNRYSPHDIFVHIRHKKDEHVVWQICIEKWHAHHTWMSRDIPNMSCGAYLWVVSYTNEPCPIRICRVAHIYESYPIRLSVCCVLLCFINPRVRKIRNEASSCLGIFSRVMLQTWMCRDAYIYSLFCKRAL